MAAREIWWNHIFLHNTTPKAHRDTISVSTCMFSMSKQFNCDIYTHLGLLIYCKFNMAEIKNGWKELERYMYITSLHTLLFPE